MNPKAAEFLRIYVEKYYEFINSNVADSSEL